MAREVIMPAPKSHEAYRNKEGKLLGGRPKTFSDERIEEEAEAFVEWMKKEDSIWYKDFAMERGYHPEYLSIWAKTNERFSQVYAFSKEWQQSKLVKGGLLNKYNGGFTKFVMANTCGWAEKTQVSGDSSNPLGFVLNMIDGTTKDLINESDKNGDKETEQ